ncbi:MAG: S46 family peptidase [Alistipes sp.]
MKKTIACVALLLVLWQGASADEGMWLIHRIASIYPQMRAEGLKLKDKEIFNEDSPALYDAVVAVDGGSGTGSMISNEGLMITNHHVAFGDICALSTPEHNYLETGFWAKNRTDEIPVVGKTVSFVRRVIDITDEANALKAEMKAAGKWGPMAMRRVYGDLEKRYQAKTPYTVSCASMWGGEMFLMFYLEVYTDVRLAGTPPVAIGAFGGDEDNWSWPQHKGDFTLYRVYADKQGRPAAYSTANVPLRPRKVLSIATQGVHDTDFAMIIGFPGRTHRYMSSFEIEEKQKVKNPIVVSVRHDRMDILKRHMTQSPEVRMAYSDAYFNLSNFADFAKWETKCLRRYDVVGIRAQEEARLKQWIEADSARKAFYGDLLGNFKCGCDAHREALRSLTYFQEAWLGTSQALLMGNRVASYLAKLDRQKIDSFDVKSPDARNISANVSRLRKNYDKATDRDILAKMMVNFTANVPRVMWGKTLNAMYDQFDGDADRMARAAFDASCCSDAERFAQFFSEKRAVADIRKDPLVALTESVRVLAFKGAVPKAERKAGIRNMDKLEALYAQALYDFREASGVVQYPNANSTMRLTYGTVGAIHPSDGVFYDYRSTTDGYLEKYNPDDYNFRVDERMRSLLAAKDWGRWGEKGNMYVNFITNNDITGGNSGSPVMNAKGDLIGLAFDGNRESMSNDIYFHPELSKTVCVDIRYVMWVIEKYADAGYLIDEMQLK